MAGRQTLSILRIRCCGQILGQLLGVVAKRFAHRTVRHVICAGREREKFFRPLPHYAPTGCAQHLYRRIRFLTICIHGHASHGAAWHIPWMHEYATPISTSRVSMAEVSRVKEGFLSSVLGERIVCSPMTEVKRPIDGNLSSVFGDGCVIRRTRKFGVWRTCLYPPYSATYSHALLLVRSYPYAFYSRDLIRDLPPQSSSITSIRNLHPQTFSRTSYPRNLYPHG